MINLVDSQLLPSSKYLEGAGWSIFYYGDPSVAKQILRWLENYDDHLTEKVLGDFLRTLTNDWALVASSRNRKFAAIDKVRSFPLFYSFVGTKCLFSNSARFLLKSDSVIDESSAALSEFLLGGYTTGNDTLISDVKQLLAGELLMIPSNSTEPIIYRYYRYLPRPHFTSNFSELINELSEITERIFRRIVDSIGDRKILVPLSGGLDSRLIVSLLRHMRVENVHTFSYGPPNNYEAKIAKYVAGRVGYTWEFIPSTHRGFRQYFWSSARKAYWEYSDGLCTIPNMQDIYPLTQLIGRGLARDAVVINGQSGDFITGGHIPKRLLTDNNRKVLIDAILEKHFSLRRNSHAGSNTQAVTMRLEQSLNEIEISSRGPLHSAALFESWEWQERQCKYVVGGQRIYDWLGLNWKLPLWDSDYLEFWARVPFEYKLGQRLYREFLRSRDYCGVFREFDPVVWRWPGAAMAVLPLAQIVGLLGGEGAKRAFYDYSRYIGHYGPNYAPWGLRKFISESRDIRNPVSLLVGEWLNEARKHGLLGHEQQK